MPVDERDLADTLERQFSLPKEETRAYLRMLELGDLTSEELARTLGMSTESSTSLLDRMKSRGLVIESAEGAKFAPLHPRMSMTNLFKVYEKDLVQSLRERRATADRVANLLTPIFEEREK